VKHAGLVSFGYTLDLFVVLIGGPIDAAVAAAESGLKIVLQLIKQFSRCWRL